MNAQALAATPRAGRPLANLAFSSLLFSILGWTLLERWSFGARAGAWAHLLNTLACAPVLACSLRRFHAACPPRLRARTRPVAVLTAAAPALALLAILGAACGIAAGSGAMAAIVAPAALCCCMPWTTLRAHQLHLFLPLLAVAAGAALAPSLAGQTFGLVPALAAAWCLWTAAAMLCVGLCGAELLNGKGGR
jgi:hypothetical protein